MGDIADKHYDQYLERFKRYGSREKLNILYNWVIQRTITQNCFKQLIAQIVAKEIEEYERE